MVTSDCASRVDGPFIQSDRAPSVAKTLRVPRGAGPAAALRLSLLRRALSIGVIATIVLLGLVSCEKKTALITYQISTTVVYRGVFVRAPGLLTLGRTGSLSLSVVEVWDARQPIPDPVGPEAIATIDSVTVQVVGGEGRSTFAGQLDRATGALTVSGVSWLNGTRTNGRFAGTDPGGGFIAIPPATQTILAYGGSWSGTRPSGDDRGALSFLIDGSVVTGIARNDDGTIDWVEGSLDSQGDIVVTFPGYTLTGSTSLYAIFGHYESTLDGGRSGNWTMGPCPF